jgi:hypothetical protein
MWLIRQLIFNYSFAVEGTRVVSNMVGYKHKMNSDYQPGLVLTVE